jgi:histidine ammonia-lyase
MKMKSFELGSEVTLEDLFEVAVLKRPVKLLPATKSKLSVCRKELENFISGDKAIYGINTGFGDLANVKIPKDRCKQLQLNIIRSHACGVGEPLSDEQVRGMMFLRANELSRCHSGVRSEVVQIFAEFLNKDVVPYVPSRGSVGASGDLAPSAHIALLLIGEGKAKVKGGNWTSGLNALKKAKINPVVLEEKEGLALINGTQAMQSVGGLCLVKALWLWNVALISSAMSLEALKGTPNPFAEEINALKPHLGQVYTARRLRELLSGSEIRQSHENNDFRVQDSYTLRCIPQVYGAVRDAIEHGINVVETEFSSVTDNPLVVRDKKSSAKIGIVSGGNFHGQALSMVFDYVCNSMVALGNMSERRTFQLVSDPSKILPPFLSTDPGVESGWMIAQYTAASIASENKTLAHPASSDSIPTSANKEDFVSMGMWAALKLDKVLENVSYLIGIELLAACRGVDFHKPLEPGRELKNVLKKVRKVVPFVKNDYVLHESIETMKENLLKIL